MSGEPIEKRSESIAIYPSPVESLLSVGNHNTPWPEEVMHDQSLAKEARGRLFLAGHLDALYQHVPCADTSLQSALASGMADESDVACIYHALSDLLEDQYNDRLILYLPFEFIPDCRWALPPSQDLLKAQERFVRLSIAGWKRLLSITDVRANFVDGDIPEEEIRNGPLPRIVKAAHLIPVLLQKGLISLSFIRRLMEDNPNTVLEASIVDTLPVLMDMGLMRREDWPDAAEKSVRKKEYHQIRIAELPEILAREIALAVSCVPKDIPPARLRWLTEEYERKAVETYASRLAEPIIAGLLGPDDMRACINLEDRFALHAAVIAVRTIITRAARIDKERAIRLRDGYAELMHHAWCRWDYPEVRNALIVTMRHWHACGAADHAELEQHGIALPRLDASFAQRWADLNESAREVVSFIRSVESDESLAQLLYPVAILFGSRIKGYGADNADLDVAVFVKPDARIEERARIRERLTHMLGGERIRGKALEFWLAKNGSGLSVRNVPDPDALIGDSTLAHVLLQGIWCGNNACIRELYRNLLIGYVYSEGKTTGTRDSRSIWLEEMERDTLQYRLMHKGYARFFPEQGGIHTLHADCIDATSMFWDSGYRRLATKLFVTRVFLPRLQD